LVECSMGRTALATFSEALAEASGAYVVILSADDLLAPGSLRRAAALLEAHPQVGFVYGWTAPFYGSSPRPTRAAAAIHSAQRRWMIVVYSTGRDLILRMCLP
jgi:cellulose synthase/poly-beta-1,6-N-acetylglucosamine synthase-like glycosyltransferase